MKASKEEIAKARALYQSDDIEIDDSAQVSVDMRDNAGYWISAWVWVEAPEDDDE